MIPRLVNGAIIVVLLLLLLVDSSKCCTAFTTRRWTTTTTALSRQRTLQVAVSTALHQQLHQQAEEDPVERENSRAALPRRRFFTSTTATAVTAGLASAYWTSRRRCCTIGGSAAATAAVAEPSGLVRAIRPNAYRVDSTIPPTLLPVATASAQLAVLRNLGRGLGTAKEAVYIDRLNLNNMLQKAVYGTANAVRNIGGGGGGGGNAPAPASFVCLGLPAQPAGRDVDLTVSLLQSILDQAVQAGKPVAIAVSAFPYPTQAAIDEYVAGTTTLTELQWALRDAGVAADLGTVYAPLLAYARQFSRRVPLRFSLLAVGATAENRRTVQTQGLQALAPADRARYVADPPGFIAATSDPIFQLYADRSLLKDAPPNDDNNSNANNFFAERILVHEAGATAVAKYALAHPGCVVAVVAPVNDLRYMGGTNGRIPRVYTALLQQQQQAARDPPGGAATAPPPPGAPLTARDVTTILLNPTAADSLSRTVRLRLEIGTGPDSLPYQTKIADYLWFSASPAVSLLPRVMDY